MRLPFCRPTKKGFPAAKFSFLLDPGIGPSRWSPKRNRPRLALLLRRLRAMNLC